MCIMVEYMTTNTQKIKIEQRSSFIGRLPAWLTNINSLFYYYLFLVLLGVVFFSTSLFINNFTTPFTGDYVTQQYSFYTNGYDDWWHFFKTGEFVLYDTNTYLGVNNIGANSFYYLFDPFFMPILMFPRQLVPQGMAIITIFKMALAGLSFYAYMRCLGTSRRASKITGAAYAFSGWMTWYLWFNHFTGVAVTFPLILIGVEYVLKKKKPYILMSTICLMGFVNFFFLFCFSLCGLLYGLFRYFQQIKKSEAKDNIIIVLLLLAGFIVGLLMTMMIAVPAISYVLTSPRASGSSMSTSLKEALKTFNLKRVFELLTSWTAQNNYEIDKARSLFPFIEFIFPVTTCRGTSLTIYGGDTYDNTSGSFYCFLPMLLLLFPALRRSLKEKHFSVLVPLVFFVFALFTPCFYYLFFAFTVGYSRWVLFVVTSIMAYTGLYLDKIKDDNFIVLIEGWSFVVIAILLGALAGQAIVSSYGNRFVERIPIWLAAVLEIAYITALVIVLSFIKIKQKCGFYWIFTGFLVVEISLMGALVIHGHGVENYTFTNKGFVKNDCLHSLIEKVKKDDNSYYRSYSSLTSSAAPNDAMRNNFNGSSTFHSSYNYNTADLCNWSAIFDGAAPASYSGLYIQKRINLDTLLGVKYYYVEDDYFAKQNRHLVSSEDFRYNVPLNYVDVTNDYDNQYFRVFKNIDYIDFALTYDCYQKVDIDPVNKNKYVGLNYGERNLLINEEMYLRAALINNSYNESVINELETKYPHLTETHLENKSLNDYYETLSIYRYGQSSSGANACLTYFDMYSANEKSLDVDASVYLTLDHSNSKYTKLGNVPENDYEQRYVEVIESVDESFPNYDPNGNIYYITSSFENKFATDIYFVDTNNKIVTFDNHNDDYANLYGIGKEERCFYIAPSYSLNIDGSLVITKPAPKIKKIILVNKGSKYNSTHNIAIDTFEHYKAKNEALKAYPVTEVVSTTNKFTFKTNFNQERIIVTRIAYEQGFKLSVTGENGITKDINVFNGQGGFVSFISGKGKCSYKLTFETPNLNFASLISSIGVFAYMSTIVAYIYLDLRHKEKEIAKKL